MAKGLTAGGKGQAHTQVRNYERRWLFIAGYHMVRLTAGGEGAKTIQLKAGDYQIPRAASIRTIVEVLSEGKISTFLITIHEGLTSYQIVERHSTTPERQRDAAEAVREATEMRWQYMTGLHRAFVLKEDA